MHSPTHFRTTTPTDPVRDRRNRRHQSISRHSSLLGIASTVSCGHLYHKKCIDAWLRKKNACPMCRYELPTSDPVRTGLPQQSNASARGIVPTRCTLTGPQAPALTCHTLFLRSARVTPTDVGVMRASTHPRATAWAYTRERHEAHRPARVCLRLALYACMHAHALLSSGACYRITRESDSSEPSMLSHGYTPEPTLRVRDAKVARRWSWRRML